MDDELQPGGTRITLPEPVAIRRAEVAERAALFGLGGFVGIFALVKQRASDAFDLALLLRWQRVKHPWLTKFMAAVSWPGFPPQSRIISPVVMAIQVALGLRLEALLQFLAWGTGGLSSLLKGLMRRERPVAGTDLRVVVAPLGGSSFPSGHVITYVGTYGWLAYVCHVRIRPKWPRRLLVGSLCALIALVGPSRIHQGHHWPTDVAASYLLGMSYLIGLAELYRRVKKRTLGAP